MNKTFYTENIENCDILDCVIIDDNIIAFSLKEYQTRENDMDNSISENRPARIIIFAPDLVQADNGYAKTLEYYKGIDAFRLAYNDAGLITLSSSDFRVEEKPDNILQDLIPDDIFRRGDGFLKNIQGITFAAGLYHKIFRRDGLHEWTDICDANEHPNLFTDLRRREQVTGSLGEACASFAAMDGFCGADIYAGGDDGDFWLFSETKLGGAKWRAITLPIRFDIKAILCADDGHIYVGGHGLQGVFKGHRDGQRHKWEEIKGADAPPHSAPNITAITFFKNTLYLSNDEGLYTLKNNTITPYIFPKNGPKQHSFGCLTSVKNRLVSYGKNQALMFDGETWKEIIYAPK